MKHLNIGDDQYPSGIILIVETQRQSGIKSINIDEGRISRHARAYLHFDIFKFLSL
jgi:hypothetical protein